MDIYFNSNTNLFSSNFYYNKSFFYNNLISNNKPDSNYKEIERLIKKAENLALKNRSPKFINLINLAYTALSNGNPEIASKYANTVINEIEPIEFNLNGDKKKYKNIEIENDKSTEDIVDIKNKPKKKRKYKDVSNDIGVSFSTPQSMSAQESFLLVPSHENEHVRRRIQEAILQGKNIRVFVSYQVRYDPETGEPYIEGGETKTIELPRFEFKKVDLNVNLAKDIVNQKLFSTPHQLSVLV